MAPASDRRLTQAQRHALAVIAAGETADRPARVSDYTTPIPTAARAHCVHWRTARGLIDAGLAVDELNTRGDGLRLTELGRAALEEHPHA